MKKQFYTNEVSVDFNYEAIDNDFLFFKIETSDKFIKGGAAFLDMDDVTFVRSIVYERGAAFYVMTSGREISGSMMTKALRQYKGGDSLSVCSLKAREAAPHLMLQLFLNALANPEDERTSYNNVAGKLLCYRPEWMDRDKNGRLRQLNCLEIRVEGDMCLQLNAHRMTPLWRKKEMKFEKRKLTDYPQYEFSYHHHTLKRVSGEKLNDKNNLIQKPANSEHGNIRFFDFSDKITFSCTKNGVLYDVMNFMRQQFSQYLKMDLKIYDIDECLSYRRKELEVYKKNVSQQLLSSGIVVIDEVQSSTSEDYLQKLCEEIKKAVPGVHCTIGRRLSKRKVNIRYIHDRTFYGEKDDPHQDAAEGYVIQHITAENFKLQTKAAVANILKELVIKKDLQDGQLGIIDWSKLGYQKDWIFGMCIDKNFFFMDIHPDGSFDMHRMKRTLFNMTEYDQYMDYFDRSENDQKDHRDVIGLIKDSKGNINLIKETGRRTFPDFQTVGDILEHESKPEVLQGKELLVYMKELRDNCSSANTQAALDRAAKVIDENAEYDKTAILNLFEGKAARKAVSDGLYKNTGIMLKAYLRGKEAREDYLSGTIDINYFKISERKAGFCVGEIGSDMKCTMDRASVIREIEAVDECPLIFKELLPLMGVEFVRYGMMTVLPFPFKYIREYAAGFSDEE